MVWLCCRLNAGSEIHMAAQASVGHVLFAAKTADYAVSAGDARADV